MSTVGCVCVCVCPKCIRGCRCEFLEPTSAIICIFPTFSPSNLSLRALLLPSNTLTASKLVVRDSSELWPRFCDPRFFRSVDNDILLD